MVADTELVRSIQKLFAGKMLVEVESPQQDLLQSGALDSLRLVELLVHLEERFGFRIAMEELDTEDLRTIDSIARLIERQQAPMHESAGMRKGSGEHGHPDPAVHF
jgi:acyl carrier protein